MFKDVLMLVMQPLLPFHCVIDHPLLLSLQIHLLLGKGQLRSVILILSILVILQ